MTANEMFEELGYKNIGAKTYIKYVKKSVYLFKEVTFYPKWKNYDTEDGGESLDITPKLHLAITQQLKELEWIK